MLSITLTHNRMPLAPKIPIRKWNITFYHTYLWAYRSFYSVVLRLTGLYSNHATRRRGRDDWCSLKKLNWFLAGRLAIDWAMSQRREEIPLREAPHCFVTSCFDKQGCLVQSMWTPQNES